MKKRLPDWFKRKLPEPKTMLEMKNLLEGARLHTICESGQCPNIWECFSKRTAAFLILGDVCTRRCTFCAVKKGSPTPVDENEPQHLLETVEKLGLRHVVITSVTRDDLPDGGASHFARTINLLRRNLKDITVEVLIPDFLGSAQALKTVVESNPHVINHNLETVPRLYPVVRPKADYQRSLALLALIKRLNPKMLTKSGLMLGLGETAEEIITVMKDLKDRSCSLLTIGQYLQPSPAHHPVVRFVSPDEFNGYRQSGLEIGFADVASAPLVRSSFKASETYTKAKEYLALKSR